MTSSARAYLRPGVPLALGSAVLVGASAPFSKLLLRSVDPWLLPGMLYLGAGIGLAVVHLGRRLVGLDNPGGTIATCRHTWLASLVLFGGMLGPVLLMFGLSCTTCITSMITMSR